MSGSGRDSAEAALRRELQPGERLLWHGRPGALGLARTRLGVLVFGLVWLAGCGAALRAELATAAGQGAAGLGSALFIGMFVLLGVGMVLGAPFALLQAHWIAYGITDRRALTVDRTPLTGRVRSVLVAAIGGVERRERGADRGDLLFLVEQRESSEGGSFKVKAGFLAIPDLRRAEAEMLRLAATRT